MSNGMGDINNSKNQSVSSWITFGVIALYDALYVVIHLTGLVTSTTKDTLTGTLFFIIGFFYLIGFPRSMTGSAKARWATTAIAIISGVVIGGQAYQ